MDCIQSQRKLKFAVGQETKKKKISKNVTATTKTLQSWIEFFYFRQELRQTSRPGAMQYTHITHTHEREEEKEVQPFYLNQCLIKWWRSLDDRHSIQVQQLKRSIIFAKFVFARVGVVVDALNKPPNSHQTHHNHCTHSKVTQCTRSIGAVAFVAAPSTRIHYLPTAQSTRTSCKVRSIRQCVMLCARWSRLCLCRLYLCICGRFTATVANDQWKISLIPSSPNTYKITQSFR